MATKVTQVADGAVTSETLALAAIIGQLIADGAVTPDKLSGPFLRAFKDTTQSAPASADTILADWVVQNDESIIFDEVTGEITYTEAGMYWLQCSIEGPDAPFASLRHEWTSNGGANWYQNLRSAEYADTTGSNRETLCVFGAHNVSSVGTHKSRFVLWHNGSTQNINLNVNLANSHIFAWRMR